MLERVVDASFRRKGLETAGFEPLSTEGAPEAFGYAPTAWNILWQVFPQGGLTERDVVLDYGCGKGRAAIWVASRFPVQRVIGLETDEALLDSARANLRRWRGTLRCKAIEFTHGDATTFQVPDDITCAYLFNPFRGQVFESVLSNLRASVDRSDRSLELCYTYPLMHEAVLAAGFSVERSKPNRRWISTIDESGAKVPPWRPPYLWVTYRA